MYGKEPWYNEHILPVPWPFIQLRFHCVLACEQALLFGQAKRASRELASEGPKKGELSFPLPLVALPLARAFSRDPFYSPKQESLLAG